MIFVIEYDLGWDMLDAAIAKRIEWDDVQPNDFRFLGEYIWQEGEPPFRGVAVVEADRLESVHAFALHYGAALRLRIRPATDVVSALQLARSGQPRAAQRNGEPRAAKRRRKR